MREQLQCCCIIVPAVRPHNRFKHLMILFPTGSSVEPWHFRRRERRPPGGPVPPAKRPVFLISDFLHGVLPCPSVYATPYPLAYLPATQYPYDADRHPVNCRPENHQGKVLLVPHVVHPEAQGPDAPPPPPLSGVITSSSIKIRRPGNNSRVRSGFRTAAPPVASMGG